MPTTEPERTLNDYLSQYPRDWFSVGPFVQTGEALQRSMLPEYLASPIVLQSGENGNITVEYRREVRGNIVRGIVVHHTKGKT